MAIGTLAPNAKFYGWNVLTGAPLAGGLLYTTAAGTSYPGGAIATYTDVGLTVANSNPIVLNSAGYCVIYLTPGVSYKFTLTDGSGIIIPGTISGVVQWTQDDISAVPTASSSTDVTGTAGESLALEDGVYLSSGLGGKTAGRWYKWDATNAYSSSTATAVGMAIAAISAGSNGSIRVGGLMPLTLTSLTPGAAYYVSTTPGQLAATTQTNTRFVGGAEGATNLVIANPPAIPDALSPATITDVGTQNNYSVAGSTIRCNNASLVTFTGFSFASGTIQDGQILLIESVGAGQVDLVHQSGSSIAANRLTNTVTSGNTSLAAGKGTAEYVYDATSTTWRLMRHEQGAPIAVPYSAGNFTASAGTFTVDVGDLITETYYLRGRQLTVSIRIVTASISSAAAIAIIAMPGGYTASETRFFPAVLLGNDNGTTVNGMVGVVSTAFLFCYAGFAGNGWSIQTNLLYIEFDVTIFVT